MKFSNIKLPSNRKFGFFFTVIFLIPSGYFWNDANSSLAYGFATLSFLLLVTTIVKADVLLPFNKLWMRFGLLLGMIVSPIVLGLIFFLLFTPIAFFMRIFGRDELHLKFKKKKSHWIKRELQPGSFKQQF
ncbi:SxtJ family membrane protein [Candidatus Pelagibacter ubique]|jgi:ABC-type Fe3+ transport system permease subunit|nr:SxtJ family membrane protein [Candidatus Pelagibacter ubique]